MSASMRSSKVASVAAIFEGAKGLDEAENHAAGRYHDPAREGGGLVLRENGGGHGILLKLQAVPGVRNRGVRPLAAPSEFPTRFA